MNDEIKFEDTVFVFSGILVGNDEEPLTTIQEFSVLTVTDQEGQKHTYPSSSAEYYKMLDKVYQKEYQSNEHSYPSIVLGRMS